MLYTHEPKQLKKRSFMKTIQFVFIQPNAAYYSFPCFTNVSFATHAFSIKVSFKQHNEYIKSLDDFCGR